MSDGPSVRAFVREALQDLGAIVSEGESLVWVQAPEALQRELEVPAGFALAFDPERASEFDAELVAPGSFFLERLVALATQRGRWDVVRCVPPEGWVSSSLSAAGFGTEAGAPAEVLGVEEGVILLFSFRVTLLSDEKRETLHQVAVLPSTGACWDPDSGPSDSDLVPSPEASVRADPEAAYRIGTQTLRDRCRDEVERFRSESLRRLDEEVRRIFRYFDRTVVEIREADPAGSDDWIRAIEGERDRRIAETLRRFEPMAKATLCSIRAILAPVARLRLSVAGAAREASLDAWSRRVHGLSCAVCQGTEGPWRAEAGGLRCARCTPTPDASARPRAGPRSDTLRRGRRAARGKARSPRGSRGPPQGVSRPRPGP